MDATKVELVIHPVRLRILQTLLGEALTTQEIAERLPDVPQSSIYRHLRLLLEGELVTLAETRLVHGIQEKVYLLAQNTHIEGDELDGISAEQHFRYFAAYVLTLLQGFARYLEIAQKSDGTVNMAADHAEYTEVTFFADDEQLSQLQKVLNAALLPLTENQAGHGHRAHKLAFVMHPVPGTTAFERDEGDKA